MPKQFIDSTKTIIYKIVCDDLNITDVYLGHTTNFINRKAKHKANCPGRNYKEYYQDNKDKIQEYNKEYRQNNKEKINAIKKTHYICHICNGTYTYSHKSRHFNSQKHQIALNNND